MNSTLTNMLQALRIISNKDTKVTPIHKTFPQKPQDGYLPSGLPEISLEEVAKHDAFNDCWIVIYDRVYDVTQFLRDHPGGDYVIMDYAGRDATLAFRGTGHSRDAISQLDEFLIGELPVKERIFRKDNGTRILSDIPT